MGGKADTAGFSCYQRREDKRRAGSVGNRAAVSLQCGQQCGYSIAGFPECYFYGKKGFGR